MNGVVRVLATLLAHVLLDIVTSELQCSSGRYAPEYSKQQLIRSSDPTGGIISLGECLRTSLQSGISRLTSLCVLYVTFDWESWRSDVLVMCA